MSDTAIDREERFRLAIVAASAPLVLLTAPLFLPIVRGRSLLADARGEPMHLAVLAFLFVPPLFVGAFGLLRSVARRAPGPAAFGVPMVPYLLAFLGMVALALRSLSNGGRGSTERAVLGTIALVGIAGAYVLGRGVRRRGWERWAQLVTGVWALHAAFAMVMYGEGGRFDNPELGAFVHTFALGAAAPAVAWILWPKRRS